MNRIRTDLAGLKPADLLQKARRITTEMAGNAHFPEPVPSLASVTAEADLLQQWIRESQFGDRRAIEQRRTHEARLVKLLRLLAHYVSLMADGDAGVLMSSGFAVRRKAESSSQLGIPVNVRAERTTFSGKVRVAWEGVAHARMYIVEKKVATGGDPNEGWEHVAATTKTRCEVTNLEPGKQYLFRVHSVGTRAKGPYSDVALVMAA